MTWEDDKRYSDKFLPEIKGHLGRHLIGEASKEEDAMRNTDLIVLRMEAVRIACRVRRNKYLGNYGGQFTIRTGRPSDIKTELAKIIEGWGDCFFYGFADTLDLTLARWFLGDLKVFRLWYMRQLATLQPFKFPGEQRVNANGDSDFSAFTLCDLPAEFILAQSK